MKLTLRPTWLLGLLLSASYGAAVPHGVEKKAVSPFDKREIFPPLVIVTETKRFTVTSTISGTCSTRVPPVTITAESTPTGCGNAGFAYAIQTHSFTNSPAPAFPSFQTDHFKRVKPALQLGILSEGVGFVNRAEARPISIYGGPKRESNYIAINHRGYFVPKKSGTYTFSSTNHDDLLLLWVGLNAFDGEYTRQNANLEIRFNNSPPLSGSYRVALSAGVAVPVRLLAVNAQGVSWRGFTFTITDPEGAVLLNQDTGSAENFVQFSCDGTLGGWKPFGGEA